MTLFPSIWDAYLERTQDAHSVERKQAEAPAVNPELKPALQGMLHLLDAFQNQGVVSRAQQLLDTPGIPEQYKEQLRECVGHVQGQHWTEARHCIVAILNDLHDGKMTAENAARSQLPAMEATNREIIRQIQQAREPVDSTPRRRSRW